MSEDCIVLHCDVPVWKQGYCWAHHQAWQRYLATLSLPDEDALPELPAPERPCPSPGLWRVRGELVTGTGRGNKLAEVNIKIAAQTRAEALDKAKETVTTSRFVRWYLGTLVCTEIRP